MRIHEMTVVNIASLKGRHHIDFDRVAKSSNLFAITGPTGSGKSTLLNCVSLALYGEVYKKGSSSTDFVTMGENFGEIQLKFSHSHHTYLSHWKLKVKKKNGEYYKKPQLTRTLFQIKDDQDDEALEKSPEDIIGLNFNQFCKTSILNQGEFAKFLKSSFVDRKDILEKFYEGENLSSLNNILKEKISQLKIRKENFKNQVMGLNQAIEEIQIDPKEVDGLESQIKEDKKAIQDLNHIFDSTKALFKFIESKAHLIKSKASIESEMNSQHQVVNQQMAKTKEAQERSLKAKKEYQDNKNILQEASKKFERKLHLEKVKTELQQKLEKIDEEKNFKTSSRDKLKKQLLENQDAFNQLMIEQPMLEQFSSFEASEFEYTYRSLHEKSIKNTLDKKRIESKQEQIKFDENELISHIEKAKEKWKDFNLDGLNKTIKRQYEMRDAFVLLHNKVDHALKEFEQKEKIFKMSHQRIQAIETRIKEATTEERELENELKLLNQSIQANQRLTQLNNFIQESHEKGECVVCGQNIEGVEHTLHELGDIENWLHQVELKNKKIEAKKQDLQDLKIELLSFQKEKQSIKEDQQLAVNSIRQTWNQQNELPLLQDKLKNDHLNIISQKISDLNEERQRNEAKALEYNMDSQKLIEDQKQLAKTKEAQQELEKEYLQLEKEGQSLSQDKKSIQKKLNIDFDDNSALSFLTNFVRQSKKAQELKELINRLELEVKAQDENLENLNKQISVLKQDLNLNRDELVAALKFLSDEKIDYDPSVRLSSLEKADEIHGHVYQTENEKLKKNQILYAETKSRYDTLSESLKATETSLSEEAEHLKNLSRQARDKQANENSVFYDILGNFSHLNDQTLGEKEVFQESMRQFEKLLTSYKEEFEASQKEFTRLQVLLKQKLENENRIKDIEEKINELQASEDQYEALNLLIGKDEFRNFVLAKIENILIDQTNKELDQLCQGRYRLTQTHKKNRLLTEFLIIDHFYGAQKRKISTLSGGETFMVSLALALALAEMTRGKTQIDSLFIDEGFGTLDQDAIEDVLELLIDMQNSGKQIGLISHVKKLTQRIPININLIKGESGLSDIEFIMN